jgi:ABC-type Fe3+ transport system substrate-binding protein
VQYNIKSMTGRCICHSEAAAAATLILGPAVASAANVDWQAGGGQKWQALLAAARKEGKVVVTGEPPAAGPVREAFKADTGIDIDFLAGNTRDVNSRFNNEARAHNLTIDVILSGGSQFPLLKEDLLEPLKPMVVLPNSGDGPWYPDGKRKFDDSAGTYMYQAVEILTPGPVVNTDLVKPGTLTKFADLLDPKYMGKIVAFDPRTGGPGLGIASYIVDSFGLDFFKKLYIGQKVKLTHSSRQLIEWLARGEDAIALGTSSADIELFRNQGFKNIVVIDPTDAVGSTAGGFSVAKVGKGAPHPKAAAVFINWYMSQRGQQVYNDAMLAPSRRTDVDKSKIPAYIVPKPGVHYLDEYAQPYYLGTRTKDRDLIVKALGY